MGSYDAHHPPRPDGMAHRRTVRLVGVAVGRGRLPLRVHLGRAPPDRKASGVRPEPDRQTAAVDGYFVLNFVGVDRLRADGADLTGPLRRSHAGWHGHEDASLKAIKYGLEERPFSIVVRAAARGAPPRVQPTAVQRDQGPGVTEASVSLCDELPRAGDLHGCSDGRVA